MMPALVENSARIISRLFQFVPSQNCKMREVGLYRTCPSGRDLLGAPGIRPHHADRGKPPGARHQELDVAQLSHSTSPNSVNRWRGYEPLRRSAWSSTAIRSRCSSIAWSIWPRTS